jgi:hypothetical protein
MLNSICFKVEQPRVEMLTSSRFGPLFLRQLNFDGAVTTSQSGQCTKSLPSSPLRGGKSRETNRDDSNSGDGKVNTISKRTVGVQRMVKHIKMICGPAP